MTIFKVKHHYQEIENLFYLLYMNEKKSNRNIFITEGLKLELGFTEDELCVIWQAFDMATQYWVEIAK